MKIVIRKGSIPFKPLESMPRVTLIHGGAGPADPKGAQAMMARDAILDVARALAQPPNPSSLSPAHLHPHLDRTTLDTSDSALLALRAAKLLETEPLFNAGLGSALQSDGVIRVSASFMESTREKFSAVMNVTEVMHPSALAWHLQTERFCVLDGMGAQNLARDLGVPRANLMVPNRLARWVKLKEESMGAQRKADGKGTIGCVSSDAQGTLAAVTSTGGVGNETAGRVGDTPTVAGNYCTGDVATSCTGYGEQILNLAFSARIATRVADGMTLEDAMERGLQEALRKGYEFAAISVHVDRARERVTWAAGTTEEYFIWAAVLPDRVVTFDD